MCEVLQRFGLHLYRMGEPLYRLADGINVVVERNGNLRRQLRRAWELVDLWREIEPVRSRPAMPLSIVKAMVVTALHWE